MTEPVVGQAAGLDAALLALADARAATGRLEISLGRLAAGTASAAVGMDSVGQAALQTRLAALEVAIETRRQADPDPGFLVLAESVRDLAARIESAADKLRRNLLALDSLIGETRDSMNHPGPRDPGLCTALARLDAALQPAGEGSGGSQARNRPRA
jgi:hypothetical protein